MRMPDFCNRLNPTHFTTALNTLTRLSIDINDIYLVAVGRYQNFRGEVQAQSPPAGTEITKKTEIRLEVGFSSAVDQLPYQFFFGFGSALAERSDDWELRARALMCPFDSSVIRTLADCQLKDLTFGFGLQREDHIRRFLGLFGIDSSQIGDDFEELLLWRNLMPYFHEWAGNAEALCSLLGQITGYECEIVENLPATSTIHSSMRIKLGSQSTTLGRDCVLGGSFEDIDTGYTLRIKNVDSDRVRDLLPGGSLRKRVERILAFCSPANTECTIEVTGRLQYEAIGKDGGVCYLGHTSFVLLGLVSLNRVRL